MDIGRVLSQSRLLLDPGLAAFPITYLKGLQCALILRVRRSYKSEDVVVGFPCARALFTP